MIECLAFQIRLQMSYDPIDPYGMYKNVHMNMPPHAAPPYAPHGYNPLYPAGAAGVSYGHGQMYNHNRQPTAVVPPMMPGIALGSAPPPSGKTSSPTAAATGASPAAEDDKVVSYESGYKAGCQAAIQQFRVVLQTMCLPQAEIRSLVAEISMQPPPSSPLSTQSTQLSQSKND